MANFTSSSPFICRLSMANFTSYSLNPNTTAAAAAACASDDASEDAFEDACCICLDPFTSDDPATITSCKHQYHLQCILDWSQISNECPMCRRLLASKDLI